MLVFVRVRRPVRVVLLHSQWGSSLRRIALLMGWKTWRGACLIGAMVGPIQMKLFDLFVAAAGLVRRSTPESVLERGNFHAKYSPRWVFVWVQQFSTSRDAGAGLRDLAGPRMGSAFGSLDEDGESADILGIPGFEEP